MTASEIIQIAATVAVVQIICDLISNWRIFNREPYQRALGALSRNKGKLATIKQAAGKEGATGAAANSSSTAGKKGGGKSDKLVKRLQRAQDDYDEAVGNVAKKHTVPSVMTSLVFVILLRILGMEHKGKIMGILPFVPFNFIRRITQRGLEFSSDIEFEPTGTKVTDISQAASFLFIYVLCTFSVKFYAHKLVATAPPVEANSFMSILETPQSKKMLRRMGVDPDELKME